MTKYYNVGKIVNTHGIHGEVRVITTSDFAEERYRKGNQLYFFRDREADGVPLIIKNHRKHKNFDLVSFENHPRINDVEQYKGGYLKVAAEDRGELDEGEFYYDQIVGSTVCTEDGKELGRVKEILSPGANDVWVVQRKGKGKDILLPYIDDVVKSIDTEGKKVIVKLLEGLVDEE